MLNVKKIAGYIMPFFAGIIGVAGLFIWSGTGSVIAGIAGILAFVIFFDFALRKSGKIIDRKFKIKTWVKHTCMILLTVLDLFAPICGLIYVSQDSMIFYNIDSPESREYLQGRPGYREIKFTAGNGKTYHGMMYQANENDQKAPLVIYFGGNGEVSYINLRMRETNGQWAYFAGYNYLFIDYEGYGLNDGRAHYLNMYEQSLAIYDYAATLPNVDSSRIVAMGYSLGTGSAVYLAANRPVSGLILAAPYANGYDFYNGALPIFAGPMKFLVRQKLPSDKYVPKVKCPVLIIASRNDEVIPFSSSERLSKLFSSTDNIDFMELSDALHNYIFQSSGVFDRVRSFLDEIA